MARLAFKPDASFFRKIAVGAVGTRAVQADLNAQGHDVVELERGSTDTKLWKEVKRKRVRVPDLVCRRCGIRIESRAKTKPELSMSHSPSDEARAWDFGMVDGDYIGFPVCKAVDEEYWGTGQLSGHASYWHERNRVQWRPRGHITYIPVREFRTTASARSTTKGVTEASETSVAWDATFCTRTGTVDAVDGQKVTVRRESDGHRYTWTIRHGQRILVEVGDNVTENQLIASAVMPLMTGDLRCSGGLADGHIDHLLESRERTQRFTGVKLARLRKRPDYEDVVEQLTNDEEEDVYIRLEGASYLVAVCGKPARKLFAPFQASNDEQTQLESVIAIGECATPDAVALLSELLDDGSKPCFLRSAAAWSLSQIGDDVSLERLVRAFSDVDSAIREEALHGIATLGGPAVPVLLAGLQHPNDDVAAGCAESLRQQGRIPADAITDMVAQVRSEAPSQWVVWLLGHLPRDHVAASISELQEVAPHLHYAISLLWSFVESWIARRWELNPRTNGNANAD